MNRVNLVKAIHEQKYNERYIYNNEIYTEYGSYIEKLKYTIVVSKNIDNRLNCEIYIETITNKQYLLHRVIDISIDKFINDLIIAGYINE